MRTTIEIPDEQRAKLLELAARRGMKGFSGLVVEALEEYLAARGAETEGRRRALAVRGTLAGETGAELREHAGRVRRQWR